VLKYHGAAAGHDMPTNLPPSPRAISLVESLPVTKTDGKQLTPPRIAGACYGIFVKKDLSGKCV
jgi:hypothetical protein